MMDSRIKFVLLFLAGAGIFLLISTQVLEQRPESFFGSQSSEIWKSTASTVLSPIKMVLVGPLLPFIDFLRQDPDTPPPFFLIGFLFYWTTLALLIHFIWKRWKPAH